MVPPDTYSLDGSSLNASSTFELSCASLCTNARYPVTADADQAAMFKERARQLVGRLMAEVVDEGRP